jgi:hypothetical protein
MYGRLTQFFFYYDSGCVTKTLDREFETIQINVNLIELKRVRRVIFEPLGILCCFILNPILSCYHPTKKPFSKSKRTQEEKIKSPLGGGTRTQT